MRQGYKQVWERLIFIINCTEFPKKKSVIAAATMHCAIIGILLRFILPRCGLLLTVTVT